jgi:hypothetical protein
MRDAARGRLANDPYKPVTTGRNPHLRTESYTTASRLERRRPLDCAIGEILHHADTQLARCPTSSSSDGEVVEKVCLYCRLALDSEKSDQTKQIEHTALRVGEMSQVTSNGP